MAGIQLVQNSAGYNAWQASQIQPLIESQQAFVLENAQEVLAFALFNCVLDEVELLNIVVTKKHQQQGLGLKLLQYCLNHYQQTGFARCLLELGENNTNAYNLYKKLGFNDDGLRKNYYQTERGKENALLMSLYFKGAA